MKRKQFIPVILALAMSVMLWAQEAPKLELRISESKVNMTREEESGETPVSYKPGDSILYVIDAVNTGNGVMNNPVVTDPVPAGVVYVPLSAEGEDADISFSINNGISYQSWPPTYTILDNDGKSIVKEATPGMVTHIRWEIKDPLQVNEQKKLEFMVEVK